MAKKYVKIPAELQEAIENQTIYSLIWYMSKITNQPEKTIAELSQLEIDDLMHEYGVRLTESKNGKRKFFKSRVASVEFVVSMDDGKVITYLEPLDAKSKQFFDGETNEVKVSPWYVRS